MNETKNPRKRYIYAFEFVDNHAYIGLTYKTNRRKQQHFNNNKHNKSAVIEHINETSLIPEYIILTKEPLHELDASNMEKYYMTDYKKNGWILLNKMKGGGLGGNYILWTYEKCKVEALKYKTKSEFSGKNASAYCSALKYGWLDEISSHMSQIIRKPKGYWTKELVHEIALQYQRRREFKLNSGDAYSFAWKNGFLDEVCVHMTLIKPKGYWTYERCQVEALKYNNRHELNKKSPSVHTIAYNNGWLNEICKHMVSTTKPMYYWNFENCRMYALIYSTKSEFKQNCSGGYNVANKNHWLTEICKHNR